MHILTKLVALSSIVSTPVLGQQCEPEFVDSSATVTLAGVSIGDREASRENFGIRIRNEGNGQCSATIRVARLNGSAASRSLSYSLQSGSNTIEILPNEASPGTSESDFIVRGIPSGPNGRNLPFIVTVPTGWGIEAGFYSEQFLVSLLDGAGNELDTQILTINIDIPSSVSMRLVGATGSNAIGTINLGEIDQERPSFSDPFGIRVWSTSGYTVSFQSDNLGVLEHDAGLDRIPYVLRMDEMIVDLAAGSEFTIPEMAPPLGFVHRLRVQAGPATARAGNYSDRVTVTVSAV